MLSAFRPYRHLIRPVLPHLVCATLLGAVYAACTGFGIPFMTRKVLPVLFPGKAAHPEFNWESIPEWLAYMMHQTLPGIFPMPAHHGLVVAEFPDRLGWQPWVVPQEHVLTFSILLLPVVFLIRAVAQFGKDYLMDYAGLRTLESLRLTVFEKLQALHLDFFRKIPAGDISQRMSGDTAIVRYALIDVFGDLVTQPFTLVSALGFVGYTAYTTPGLERFFISLLIVPATVLPIRYVGKKLQRRARQMLDEGGAMNAMLVESIQAPREIRAYNLQERENARYRARTNAFLRFQMKVVKYEKSLSPFIDFIAACSISFAIWQVVRVNATVDTGTIVSLVGALYFCYDPLKRLGGINSRLKQAGSALDRLNEILKAPIEVPDPIAPKTLPQVRGEIVFEKVGFAYPSAGDTPVFGAVDLVVRPGEVVALVGPSGSGKSTFANLVPRFYDATSGRVLVDGVDVREVAQADLRSHIALVSQEPILFDDTVAANLRLGKPDATDAEVREAARKAGALDFIEALSSGFDTRVGERGGLLSGGQRQRLAIARAFLKDAPILILDEATSALDAETEAQIQASLEALVRGKTVFIIAHRFSTIRFATRILVFDKAAAGVAADGTHDSLLRTSPIYRNLWERQNPA